MYHKLSLLLLAIQAAICLASKHHPCLTYKQANLTTTRLRSILSLQSSDLGTTEQTVEKLLADNYASSSDSYSMIAGRLWQVGRFNTTNKQQELATGEVVTLTQTGIQTIELAVVNCHKIFWFWNLTHFGNDTLRYPVRGMHLLTMNEHLQIHNLYTETNALAFAADLGFTIAYPNGTSLPSAKPNEMTPP